MKMILGGLFLFWGIFAQAAASDPMSVNVDPKQSKFDITLSSNPTTGYQWTVTKYDESLLQLISSQYIKPQSQLMGAGGQMVFTFELNDGQTFPANTIINFKYAQPWEPDKGSNKTVTVNFTNSNIPNN